MSIHQHFRADEKVFVEQMLDITRRVEERHIPQLTDFLDPREQFIARSVAGSHMDVSVAFEGGYASAERKRALFVPDYWQPEAEEYRLQLIQFEQPAASRAFQHRDILGSLLGLGIRRGKLGDILLADKKQQVIADTEISDYIQLHLRQVGRQQVYPRLVDWSSVLQPDEQWRYEDTTVSSLRLDVLLARMLRSSRNKVTPLIKSGRVKLNWKVVEQPSVMLEEGDMLSVKGFGRFLFHEIHGMTKKQKYHVSMARKV